MRLLITSGGTKVPIDSVRHIGNMSSGTFGSKIALEALKRGHSVTFLYAKGSKHPLGLRVESGMSPYKLMKIALENAAHRFFYQDKIGSMQYSDFDDYAEKLRSLTGGIGTPYDAVVLAAAASDYGVDPVVGKIRSTGDLTLHLKPLPKLIGYMRGRPRVKKLVGFKLLVNSTTEELLAAAKKSIETNGCDLVVANDLRDIKMNEHCLHLVSSDGSIQRYDSCKSNPNYLARKVVEAIEKL